MDAIGFASSLISLVQLTYDIILYLKDVKDAPQDRIAIYSELTSLQNLLVILKNRVEQSQAGDPWLDSVRALGVAGGPLERFRGDLETLASKLQKVDGMKKVRQMLAWKFTKEEVMSILEGIERTKSYISLALQNDHLTLSQAIKAELDGVDVGISTLNIGQKEQELRTMHMQNTLSDITVMQEAQGKRSDVILGSVLRLASAEEAKESVEIGEWLSKANYWTTQSENFSKRVPGTGVWLLESTEYKTWSSNVRQSEWNALGGIKMPEPSVPSIGDDQGDLRTLWCPGDPGVGKTVLASAVVNDLIETYKVSEQDIAVLCIYCSYKQQKEQTVPEILSSILKQVVQHRVKPSDNIKILRARYQSKGAKPTFDEIIESLKEEMKGFAIIFLILDALDELTEADGTRAKLLSVLASLPPQFRLLVTSRDVGGIGDTFTWDRKLPIRASTEDLKAYVQSRMLTETRLMKLLKGNAEMSDDIVNKVTEKAEGMFLLARLHMDALSSKSNKKALMGALSTLPSGINATYDEALERIDRQSEDDRLLANQVFMWLTYAARPIKVKELQHALVVEEDMEEFDEDAVTDPDILTSVCAGLVVIDNESQTIKLVHYTTQEYFEKIREKRFPDAQMKIMQACLTYISVCGPETGYFEDSYDHDACLEKNPFFEYAAQYWGIHAKDIASNPTSTEVIVDFLSNNPKMLCAVQSLLMQLKDTLDYSNSVPEGLLGIHAAAIFGFDQIVRHFLDEGVDPNTRDTKGRTPLFYAAEYGHEAVVTMLLEVPNIIPDWKDWMGLTALSYAAIRGHNHILSLLLQRQDVDPNSLANDKRTTLSLAAENHQEEAVKILLQKTDIDVNIQDENGLAALHYAAKEGNLPIVKTLLAHPSIQVDILDSDGQSALFCAAEEGNAEVVQCLLENKSVKADRRSKSKDTPLLCAAGNEDSGCLKLLLARPEVVAQVNSGNNGDETPLIRATYYEHVDNVRQLLAVKGISPDLKDDFGKTALAHAVETGNSEILQILLDRADVTPDFVDNEGQSPLALAAASGGDGAFDCLKLLMEHDNKFDVKDKNGRTPLSQAAEMGREVSVSIIKLLLEKGADPDSEDNLKRTPLSYAASDGNVEIVRLLLETGRVKADSVGNDGRTPLSYAAESGSSDEALLKLFLDRKDVKVDSIDREKRTPFSYAASCGEVHAIRLFLDRDDVDFASVDRNGRTPLSHIPGNLFKGGVDVVSALLEKKGVVGSLDNSHRSPLSHAAELGDDELVTLLLEKDGEHIDTKSSIGRTPLSYAAVSGKATIVKALLERNVDVNSKSDQERTPLSYAAESYDGVSIVKTLLSVDGVEVDIADKHGITPLYYASGDDGGGESPDIVRLLLATGRVDASKVTDQGSTPLIKASRYGLHATVELLLTQPTVDVNYQNKNGETALLVAASKGHLSVVDLLTARPDIDVNLQNNNGLTALMCAAQRGHIYVVKQLLKCKNIDINLKSKNGNTAEAIARREKRGAIVDVLMQWDLDRLLAELTA